MEKFEVHNITTSYDDWLINMKYSMVSTSNIDDYVTDKCLEFASKQSAFMTGPVAKFGDVLYEAVTRQSETLDDIEIDGPLYRIAVRKVFDKEKGKTEEREYIDPNTIEPKFGKYYPDKTVYIIRFGRVNS